MDIRPILAALRRHRLATMLIALEIALACAVLCNACFLIVSRLDLMKVPSGVDESSLAQLRLDCDGCNESDLNARALSARSPHHDTRMRGCARIRVGKQATPVAGNLSRRTAWRAEAEVEVVDAHAA